MAEVRDSISTSAAAQIRDAVDRALVTEAQRSELSIAYVRVALLGIYAFAFWVAPLSPFPGGVKETPSASLAFMTGWFVVACGLVVILRRGRYPRWLVPVLIFLDAACLTAHHHFAAPTWGPTIHTLHTNRTLALGCAVLAAAGGLRLDRRTVLASTLLAALAYVVGVHTTLGAEHWRFTLVYVGQIFAIGLLGLWMTRLVRRAATSEIGRAMLGRFLPPDVIARAHEDPLRLVGPPRALDATALVSDVRGFTHLAETRSPAEVLAFLSELQGAFAAVVMAHGGTVDKFLGDGMLAVFGAPEPLVDHAARALDAVGDLRGALSSINARHLLPGVDEVRCGFGLHSGPVVAGCLGGGARLEFTVIGDAVNVATRIEALTKEHGTDVLVSRETAERAGRLSSLRSIGTVTLRGRSAPLELLALPQSASPPDAGPGAG